MRPVESSAALQDLPPVSPRAAEAPPRGSDAESAAALARAERLVGEHQYAEALSVIGDVHVPAVSAPRVALRILFCESWSRMYLGQLAQAVESLERARGLAESPVFNDCERAETLFRLGCCRLKLSRVSNAVSLFGAALALVPEGLPEHDALRARIFDWRSRCYQLQREWDSAQSDAERSLDLARSVGDARLMVLAKMQCSLVAERRGDPLTARYYAEQARALASETGDRQTEARLLNNLGGLSFLVDDAPQAVAYLKEAFALSLDVGNEADAAQAISSLAQVHLRCGAPQLAEEQARHALELLEGRDDYRDERGNLHLVLGRSLLEQSRRDDALAEFAAAEWLFEQVGSTSHIAAAWMAEAEAYERDGDLQAAVALYRRAAQSLQDFNF